MKKIFTLVLFILIADFALAQQDPQFSQYMLNPLIYNPAFAGVEGVTKLTAIHRTQWAGYSGTYDGGGAPSTQFVTLNTPVLRVRSGVGFALVNDNLGPKNNMEAQISYAYHLGIRNSKMSFGIRTGIFSQTINYDKYRAIHKDDPVLLSGKESQVRPDLALGIFYRSEKFYSGVSFNHLLKSEFDFGLDTLRNALENHMYFTFGYDYESSYDLIITPTILLKSDFNTYSFDASVIGTYREKLWGGLSYRQSEAAVVMIGYSLFKDNSLQFGYAFDYIIRAQDAKKPTSHELLLSYSLPVTPTGGKKIIRTPRFRH